MKKKEVRGLDQASSSADSQPLYSPDLKIYTCMHIVTVDGGLCVYVYGDTNKPKGRFRQFYKRITVKW